MKHQDLAILPNLKARCFNKLITDRIQGQFDASEGQSWQFCFTVLEFPCRPERDRAQKTKPMTQKPRIGLSFERRIQLVGGYSWAPSIT